jgi:predicted metal-dependent hydrolase
MATVENTRQLTLGERPITYTLRRSSRRTIGLAVDHRGLRVSAPSRARIGDIEQLLYRHQQWVIEKLDTWEQRVSTTQTTAQITTGTAIPWLNKTLTLYLEPTSTAKASVFWTDSTLTLCLRANTDPQKALRKALMDAAKRYFEMQTQRLVANAQQLSPPLFLDPPPLSLTSAKTRWGSCSLQAIRLNWRLMHFAPELVDYVVAHELAHLVEMNHSPRFWAVVERLYPDWQTARRELRQVARTCPQF